MKRLRGSHGAPLPAAGRPVTAPPGPDTGPVIVLVDHRTTDAGTLEWAAAEAAARGSTLRIVYAFRWPRIVDPLGNATVDLRAQEAAEAVVEAAVRRARKIVPGLRISTRIFPGRQVTALVSEARHSPRSLVVLSHHRQSGRLERALARRLVRRTSTSLALIGLSAPGDVGRSAGRVVVGVDAHGGPPTALGFAFRAARRRGTGLTVVHASAPHRAGDAEDAVRVWQMAYPDVDVQWDVGQGPLDSAVLAESAAAALTVIGPWRHRLGGGSASGTVLRLTRGPVVLVGASSS
ncbi:universal stress protein [Kribbella sp. CA-247076]|uniref:universal stress protein n=1 Tax=Kribbella sp. CA-247076 TaxID=3239941 RepID=UPI003D8AF9FC